LLLVEEARLADFAAGIGEGKKIAVAGGDCGDGGAAIATGKAAGNFVDRSALEEERIRGAGAVLKRGIGREGTCADHDRTEAVILDVGLADGRAFYAAAAEIVDEAVLPVVECLAFEPDARASKVRAARKIGCRGVTITLSIVRAVELND